MLEKTNKTVILLKFEDPNNPAKDECNNVSWTFDRQNHEISYDEETKEKICMEFMT